MPADASELRKLADDLDVAADKLARDIVQVMRHGAVNIKKQLIAEAGDSKHFRGMVTKGKFSYDEKFTRDRIEFTIGPEASGGGLLDNIAYFGTSRGGGTLPDPVKALEAEADRVVAELTKLLGGVL